MFDFFQAPGHSTNGKAWVVWGLPGLRYQDVTTLSQALAERDQEAWFFCFFWGKRA